MLPNSIDYLDIIAIIIEFLPVKQMIFLASIYTLCSQKRPKIKSVSSYNATSIFSAKDFSLKKIGFLIWSLFSRVILTIEIIYWEKIKS